MDNNNKQALLDPEVKEPYLILLSDWMSQNLAKEIPLERLARLLGPAGNLIQVRQITTLLNNRDSTESDYALIIHNDVEFDRLLYITKIIQIDHESLPEWRDLVGISLNKTHFSEMIKYTHTIALTEEERVKMLSSLIYAGYSLDDEEVARICIQAHQPWLERIKLNQETSNDN